MKYEIAALVTLGLSLMFARAVGEVSPYGRLIDVLTVWFLVSFVATIFLAVYGVFS